MIFHIFLLFKCLKISPSPMSSELREVMVDDKIRIFSFHEDYRPPYTYVQYNIFFYFFYLCLLYFFIYFFKILLGEHFNFFELLLSMFLPTDCFCFELFGLLANALKPILKVLSGFFLPSCYCSIQHCLL